MGLNTGEIIAIFIIIIVIVIISTIACYKCWRSMTKIHRDSVKPRQDFARNLQQSFRQSLRRVGRREPNPAGQIPVTYHRNRQLPSCAVDLDDPASERSEIHPRYLPQRRHTGGDAPPTYAEALTHQKVEERGGRHPSYLSKTTAPSLSTISGNVPSGPSRYDDQPVYAVPNRQKVRQTDDQQPLHVPSGLVYSGSKYSKPSKSQRKRLKNLQSLKYLTRKDDSGSEYASTDSTSDGEDDQVENNSMYSERYIGTPNEFNKMTPHFSTYNERYVGSPAEIDSSYRDMREHYLRRNEGLSYNEYAEPAMTRTREGSRKKKSARRHEEELYAVPHANRHDRKTCCSREKEQSSNLPDDRYHIREDSHRTETEEGCYRETLRDVADSRQRYEERYGNTFLTGNVETGREAHVYEKFERQRNDYNGRDEYNRGRGHARNTDEWQERSRESARPVVKCESNTRDLNDRHIHSENILIDSHKHTRSHELQADSSVPSHKERSRRTDQDSRRRKHRSKYPPVSSDSHEIRCNPIEHSHVHKDHIAGNHHDRNTNTGNMFVGSHREEIIAGSITQGRIFPSRDSNSFEDSAFVPVTSGNHGSQVQDRECELGANPQQNYVIFNQDLDSIGLDTYI